MSLLVRAPDTYAAERRYIFDVVLSEWLGLEYHLEPTDGSHVSIQVVGDTRGMKLTLPDVLFATSRGEWCTERSMPSAPLARLAARAEWPSAGAPGEHQSLVRPLPVVFGEPNAAGQPWRVTEAGIALSVDVFGSAFFCLARYEEVVRSDRDKHERFPASASIAAAEGFVDRPIVDEYVDLLWMAMQSQWPELTRRRSPFRLRLTHDVDHPWAAFGERAVTVAHAVGGDLVRRRDPALAARRVRAYVGALAGRVDGDPFNTFDFLMTTSERHGLQSVFYIIAGRTTGTPRSAWYAGGVDGSYRLSDPPVARLLQRIHDRGHEVGLHASYGTYQSAELTRAQFEALKTACRSVGFDQPTWGVRQHYLRFENPGTWRNHESAGLDYDSTLGFADQVGFRAGTCREYPLFDLLARRRLRLRERPLLVMDTTLFDDRGLGLDATALRTLGIVDACRRQNGDAVLLFHNSNLAGARLRAFYSDLVQELVRAGS
jgi:hypothetical protein